MAPWIGFVLMAIAVISERVEGKRDEVLYCSGEWCGDWLIGESSL